MKRMLIAACAAALMSSAAFAEQFTVGALTIDTPWTRATPMNAPVGGGFMVITNTGDEADRLIGGSVAFADHVEVHEMKVVDDVMKMRELDGGLEIPAGGSVTLQPGGFHIMFMGLKEQLTEGETRPVTLTFEKAGDVEIEVTVENMGKGRMHKMPMGGQGQGMGQGMKHGQTN